MEALSGPPATASKLFLKVFAMEVGIGLDSTLGLSLQQEASISEEAARLGYTSVWTPSTSALDPFHLCTYRWSATRAVVPEGLATGISVMPVLADGGVSPAYLQNPVGLAARARTAGYLTGGRFILGIGTGGIYRAEVRRALGVARLSALAVMRDYLVVLRALLAGETVTHDGAAWRVRGARLSEIRVDGPPPPPAPVYLAALGPEMLRLAGELADGVALNWCSPEQTAWSRQRIAEGAARAARDPALIKVIDYIRVCVDDDEDVARRAFGRAVLQYALGPRVPSPQERRLGYRAHFERMGFADTLAELDRLREQGAPPDDLVDAVPRDLLMRVGYYGRPDGAAEAVRRLSQGLDTAIVRVVAARPGVESVRAVMRACQPHLVLPA